MTEHAAPRPLHRSRSDKMVAGVCGGLAQYFDIHPAFFRVGFVVLALLGGAGVLAYVAAVLVIPAEGRHDSIAAEMLRDRSGGRWGAIGLALVAVAGFVLLSHATLGPHGGGWVLLFLAGLVIVWAQRRDAEGRRRGRLLRALVVVFAALVLIWLVGVTLAVTAYDVHIGDGVGHRVYRVSTVDNLDRNYRMGVGDLELDLRDVEFPNGRTTVDARLGVGHIKVIVPDDVRVRWDADVRWGDVDAFGDDNLVAGTIGRGDAVLVLHTRLTAGRVEIDRAVR